MASIDLYGGDAGQIRSAYQTHLGRDASNDEVSGWLSGTYGGGGLNDWLSQIQNSDDAKNRRAPVIGQNPNVSRPQDTPRGIDDPYWTQPAQPGVGTPESGFGWGGVENPWYQASNRIRDAYTQYLGRSASQDEVTKWLSGGYGYGSGPGSADAFVNAIRSSSGYQGPSGTTQTAGPPGGNYQAWISSLLQGSSSPDALLRLESTLNQQGIRLQKDSAGNVRGRLYLPDGKTVDVVSQWGQPWTWIDRGMGGPSQPGDQYNDPNTQYLEQMLKQMIALRMNPVFDANRTMYEQVLKQRADALGAAEPKFDQLLSYLQQRFQDLQGPGRTGAEQEVIRTQALDPIERDRQAARKRVIERLSARGLNLDSGISQQMLLDVDRAFDEMRATSQNVLAVNELNRREDRAQRAQGIASALYDIPQQRAREQLDVFSALNELSGIARAEDEARQREALGYSGALADLGPQRLQLAMQAAGMGGSYEPMSNALFNLAGLNQNAALLNQRNQSSWLNQLGSTLYYLSRVGV